MTIPFLRLRWGKTGESLGSAARRRLKTCLLEASVFACEVDGRGGEFRL